MNAGGKFFDAFLFVLRWREKEANSRWPRGTFANFLTGRLQHRCYSRRLCENTFHVRLSQPNLGLYLYLQQWERLSWETEQKFWWRTCDGGWRIRKSFRIPASATNEQNGSNRMGNQAGRCVAVTKAENNSPYLFSEGAGVGGDRWRGEQDSGRQEKLTVFIIVWYILSRCR